MAFDAFLKIANPDVKGESTDTKHAGEIEVVSYSIGASNPSTIGSGTTGSGGGKVVQAPFQIVKFMDSSSAILYQMCASGGHSATATFTLRKAGGKAALEYIIYTFTEVYVDSIIQNGTSAASNDRPTETVSFSYATMHVKYTPQKPDGTGSSPIEGGWDFVQNQPK